MKKVVFILTLFISAGTFAQSTMKEDVDIIQGIYGKTKKEIVVEYMGLTGTKSDAFFKLYDAYEAERKALGQTKIKLIEDYANKFEALNDVSADELAKAAMKNNMDYEKLYSKYYKKTKSAVGALDAAKFIQLEVALQTAIRYEIQDAIPYIGELEKTKTK